MSQRFVYTPSGDAVEIEEMMERYPIVGLVCESQAIASKITSETSLPTIPF